MKRLFAIAALVCLLFAACAPAPAPVDTPPAEDITEAPPADVDPDPADVSDLEFPGIIAVVTNTVDQNEEEFRSGEANEAKPRRAD